jgi:2,5-furandicarboxylate decarboxylase 1
MKLERDLLLVAHAGTDRSEAMEDGGLVTKAGFDATAKTGDRVEGIDRALPPPAHSVAAKKWFTDNLPPERRLWLK